MYIKTFCGGYDSNFCYIVYDAQSKKCCIIDPSVPASDVLAWIQKEKLIPLFVVVMHSHFDHIVDLQKYQKANIPIYAHASMREDRTAPLKSDCLKAKINHKLTDHEEFGFENITFNVLHTPGHLYDAICLLVNEKHLFTSDTLFVESCGRVDLEGAEPEKMAKTLQRLRELPEEIMIYPGHDYGSTPTSTIGREKKNNRFLKY